MKLCYLGNPESIHLIKRCNAMHSLGHNVHVISFIPARIDSAEVHYIRIPFQNSKVRYLLAVEKVRKVIHSLQPDVVDAQYATGYGLLGALSGFHPLVVTAWGSDILISPVKSFIYKTAVRYALKRADAIVAVSADLADRITTFSVSSDKISIIWMGVDLDFFSTFYRKERGNADIIILSTRLLQPGYQIDRLIYALSLVKEQFASFRTILAGEGPEKKKLVRLVETLKLTDRVEFVGFLPHKEIISLFFQTDIFVSCSMTEGTSESLLEAMASGVFPIVAHIPSNRYWIEDGFTGFLTSTEPQDLAEKIIKAVNDKTLRDQAARANLLRIKEEGSLKTNMRKLESLYQSLIGR